MRAEALLNFLNFNLKKMVIFILLLLLPLISINMEQKHFHTPWFSKPFTWFGSLVQDSLYGFSTGIRETTAMYLNLIEIKKTNADLKSKNQEMATRQLKLEELELENARLKALLDFKASTKMELVPAQVIGRDLFPDHKTITINKGTQQGLKAGQAVMTTAGAIGYVFRPEALTSHVLLLTDRYSVVDAVIQRTRARGIVEGSGSGHCVLKYLERTDDIKPGDLVVTGGLDNIFPKGFPVATIESMEKKNMGVSVKVSLKTLVDTQQVEEVFVVMNAASEDFTPRFNPEPH